MLLGLFLVGYQFYLLGTGSKLFRSCTSDSSVSSQFLLSPRRSGICLLQQSLVESNNTGEAESQMSWELHLLLMTPGNLPQEAENIMKPSGKPEAL